MDDTRPVFEQIMEIVENGIIGGTYGAGELVISTTQISRLYGVNPATAVKAIGRLAEGGLLVKKPGIGMCVAEGAREKIVKRRREAFLGSAIDRFLAEAKTLGIAKEEIIAIVNERKN